METIKQLFIKYKEIIMYLIMGGGTTVVNWVAYSLMVMFCHPGNNLTGPLHISASTIDVFVANVVSWVLAVTFAYITNKLFVFESYSWNPKFVKLILVCENRNRFNRNLRCSFPCKPRI